MARLAHQKNVHQTHGAGSTRAAQVARQRKRQKVVLESVSKDKNKLRSVISFRADPPPGYTFIPAGNPELTAALKEFARKANHKIFSVSTTPHASRHELSREVHRIGYHFPTEVVSQVCAHYGIRLTSGGRLIDENQENDKLFMKVYQRGQLVLDEKVQDQVTINTEAKQIITDLFPNIPDKDMFQIIKTAFQLGDGKVGTADEIPLVRRAQLSVVAHVRHVYTDYDKLLRRVPYNEARHRVEKETLSKLVEWRGEDDNDEANKRAVDDIFKEVIVISDEEDSESDDEDAEQIGNENLRIEELPYTAYEPTQNRPRSPVIVLSADEAPSGYRFVPQVARRHNPTTSDVTVRDRNRYAIWDQARRDYRSGLGQTQPVYERIYLPEPVEIPHPQYLPLDLPSNPVRNAYEPAVIYRNQETESRPILEPDGRTFVRGADGVMYERIVTRPAEIIREPLREVPRNSYQRMTPPLVASHPNSRPMSPRILHRREHMRTPSFEGGDGTILPSIEGPNGAYSSTVARNNPFLLPPSKQSRPAEVVEPIFFDSPRRRNPPVIDLTEIDDYPRKRYRVDAHSHDQSRQGKVIVSGGQQYARGEKLQTYPPRTRSDQQIIEISESPQVRPRDDRFGVRENAQLQPLQNVRGIQRSFGDESPGYRRILVPENNLRTAYQDETARVDTSTHHKVHDDRYVYEQPRYSDGQSFRQTIEYEYVPERRPLEAVNVEDRLTHQPIRREYLPSSDRGNMQDFSSRAPEVFREARMHPITSGTADQAYSIHSVTTRRHEELPPGPYVRH